MSGIEEKENNFFNRTMLVKETMFATNYRQPPNLNIRKMFRQTYFPIANQKTLYSSR